MKKIIRYAIVIGSCLLASATKAENPVAPVNVQSNQAVLDVKGMVCAHCAKAAHKQLAGAAALDQSLLQNGLHIDIDKKQIVMALLPGKSVDYHELQEAVEESDCELLRLHMRLQGRLEKKGDRLVLIENGTGKSYPITLPREDQLTCDGNDEYLAWYHVASMACAMGNLEESKKSLRKAVELGGDEVMLMALRDARLQKLWTGQQTTLQVGIQWDRDEEVAKKKSMHVVAERVIELNP